MLLLKDIRALAQHRGINGNSTYPIAMFLPTHKSTYEIVERSHNQSLYCHQVKLFVNRTFDEYAK